MLTPLQILTELNFFYSKAEISNSADISYEVLTKIEELQNISTLSVNKLHKFFNTHCTAFARDCNISELFNLNQQHLIHTPDGFSLIKNVFKKGTMPCVKLRTDVDELCCSEEHWIQTDLTNQESWKHARDFCIGDVLETDSGARTIVYTEKIGDKDVYDVEVDHANHRYWAGGLSNHNCGKSMFVMKILANAQKQGLIPVIFDTENAIDPESAARLGLDTSKVKYIPTFNIEQCRNNIHKFLTNVKEQGLHGKFIVAIDSLGNLESQMEQNRIEKESTSMDMGTRARAIKSLLRTCTQLSAITNTPIIITNHIYDNPGELHPTLVKSIPGGKSTLYMPSLTIQLMRKPVKEDVVKAETGKLATLQKNYVGALIRALTVKNRFIKQYLEAELYLSFNTGVDKYHGLLDLAVGLGVIEQTGSTFLFNGNKLGYAKSFQNDVNFWENDIIPLIEEKIKIEWAYSSENQTDDLTSVELDTE